MNDDGMGNSVDLRISQDSPGEEKDERGGDEYVPGAVHVRVVERRLREPVQTQRHLFRIDDESYYCCYCDQLFFVITI